MVEFWYKESYFRTIFLVVTNELNALTSNNLWKNKHMLFRIKLGKEVWGIENRRKKWDHRDFCIIKICLNNSKSPGDPSWYDISPTPLKSPVKTGVKHFQENIYKNQQQKDYWKRSKLMQISNK